LFVSTPQIASSLPLLSDGSPCLRREPALSNPLHISFKKPMFLALIPGTDSTLKRTLIITCDQTSASRRKHTTSRTPPTNETGQQIPSTRVLVIERQFMQIARAHAKQTAPHSQRRTADEGAAAVAAAGAEGSMRCIAPPLPCVPVAPPPPHVLTGCESRPPTP
jgi:hypothetical protein